MTATVTATAATNGKQQRPATARDARIPCDDSRYGRPEKQTVSQWFDSGFPARAPVPDPGPRVLRPLCVITSHAHSAPPLPTSGASTGTTSAVPSGQDSTGRSSRNRPASSRSNSHHVDAVRIFFTIIKSTPAVRQARPARWPDRMQERGIIEGIAELAKRVSP